MGGGGWWLAGAEEAWVHADRTYGKGKVFGMPFPKSGSLQSGFGCAEGRRGRLLWGLLGFQQGVCSAPPGCLACMHVQAGSKVPQTPRRHCTHLPARCLLTAQRAEAARRLFWAQADAAAASAQVKALKEALLQVLPSTVF